MSFLKILIKIEVGVTTKKNINPITTGDILQTEHSLNISTDGNVAGIQLLTSGDFTISESYLPEGWEIHHENGIVLAFSTDGSSLVDDQLFQYTGDLMVESGIIADWHGNGITAGIVELPGSFYLAPAYPNPFNPITTMEYSLPEDSHVSIVVYDMLGRNVAELLDSYKTAGYHTIQWNASDQSSGVYLVKMVVGDNINTQKLMLIK